MTRESVSLFLRNLTFTVVVPGVGAVLGPWLVLGGHGHIPDRRFGRSYDDFALEVHRWLPRPPRQR